MRGKGTSMEGKHKGKEKKKKRRRWIGRGGSENRKKTETKLNTE